MQDTLDTVVLLHSSASSSRQWDALAHALGARFRVRAIDFHGHGDRPPWRVDVPLTLADDAAPVRSLLADGGVHLVGHSYGAAVALKLAVEHPQWVRSVVAYEPVLFRLLADEDANEALRAWLLAARVHAQLARGDECAAARAFTDYWCGQGAWLAMPPQRRQSIAQRMAAVDRQFEAVFGEPMLASTGLAALRMPMLFLSGARTVPPAHRIAERLRKALPRAQHAVVPHAGHLGPISHAGEVNARIAAFLQDVPRQARHCALIGSTTQSLGG